MCLAEQDRNRKHKEPSSDMVTSYFIPCLPPHSQGRLIDSTVAGKGFHMFTDASWYEGEWDFDRQHGEGEAEFPDGTLFKGR